MKFSPDVIAEALNQNKLTLFVSSVNHKQESKKSQFLEMQHSDMLRIIDINIQNWSWKFQIDISKIGYFREQSL